MIDLLIVGGGPAGLATAIHGAMAGMEAVVIERKQGVIDKACGEGLMPSGVAALATLSVDIPRSYSFSGIRYHYEDHVAQGHFRQGEGWGVRRVVLHQALRERAAALGVRMVQGRVVDFLQQSDWVEANGMRARYLVAADGLNSSIRRAMGLDLPPRRVPRVGMRRHYSVEPWSDYVEVYWGEQAEAYVTPLDRNLIGVAVLGSGKWRFEERLSSFPQLMDRLPAPSTPAMGKGPFERRVRRRVHGRVLLVGDAAGFLDPITGEGVQLALAAAQQLVCCVHQGRPELYERAWWNVVRRYWWTTSALLWLSGKRTVRRRMVPLLKRFPCLFDRGLEFLMRQRLDQTTHE